ncbi:hypothetical protein F5887DRAFT_957621 [Amanita rubescens]|nr:hypothetical protein F5887DRAFT_1019569 [Amanita rubescens]KAF8347279.1 hypothetical protein F5887DRAFT_957621 [Amanita rubescens]
MLGRIGRAGSRQRPCRKTLTLSPALVRLQACGHLYLFLIPSLHAVPCTTMQVVPGATFLAYVGAADHEHV